MGGGLVFSEIKKSGIKKAKFLLFFYIGYNYNEYRI
jgi:hypothetical protein